MKAEVIEFLTSYQEMRKHWHRYWTGSKHKSHMDKAKKIEKDLDRRSVDLLTALQSGQQGELF